MIGTKPKPYLKPTRPLALEAGIIAACAGKVAVSKAEVDVTVFIAFPWAMRGEIYATLDRMIAKGRVVEVHREGRTLPLYTLPPAGHASHAPAPSSPAA